MMVLRRFGEPGVCSQTQNQMSPASNSNSKVPSGLNLNRLYCSSNSPEFNKTRLVFLPKSRVMLKCASTGGGRTPVIHSLPRDRLDLIVFIFTGAHCVARYDQLNREHASLATSVVRGF